MIEIRVKDLASAMNTLKRVVKDMKVSAPLALQIARILKVGEEEIDIIQAQVNQLEKKYLLLDSDGSPALDANGRAITDPKRVNDYSEEFNALMTEKIKVTISPLPMTFLDNKEEWSPEIVKNLLPILE